MTENERHEFAHGEALGDRTGTYGGKGLHEAGSQDTATNLPVLVQPGQNTVVIIEPRTLIRDCLLRSFRMLTNGETILAFASIDEWQRYAAQFPPANLVVLCAGGKNDEKQIERDINRILQMERPVSIVVLSEVEEADQILEALDSGAKGYIPTSISLDVAVEALHLVKAGGIFVPASSLISSRRSIEEHAHSAKLPANRLFTARQAAVVSALRQGKANKRIAYELNMQESTVKVHVRNIMRKLKAKNRTEVAVLTQGLFLNSRDDE